MINSAKLLKFVLSIFFALSLMLHFLSFPGAPVMLMALTLFISTLFIATSLLRDQLKSKSD
jgi:hypothetical protein